MKANVPTIARWGIPLGVIILIFGFIVQAVAGEVVGGLITQAWNLAQEFFEQVFRLAGEHLAATALIVLFVYVGILVGHAYVTTLPLKGILFHPIDPTHAGEGAWSGFVVENRSGEDFDRVWIAHKQSDLALQWGRGDAGSEYKDIPHWKKAPMSWLYFNYSTKQTSIRKTSLSPMLPLGISEIELEIGVTPKGKALYTKPLYVTVEITEESAKVISTEW